MPTKLNVVVNKEKSDKKQSRINAVVNMEKENNSKFIYLPDYIRNLYEMYVEQGINLAILYEKELSESNHDNDKCFNIYKKFLLKYATNTYRFKVDLNRILSMMEFNIDENEFSKTSNEIFLYQVLEGKVEKIYLMDAEYNKKEKAVSRQIQKEKRERAEDRRKLKRKKKKH